ncbi:MAG TPA: response regulator [Caldilineae bacterium]|nr:response regulator [Caldilineae bacterium]
MSALEDLGEEVESVLIVDDEPEVVRLFSRMIASAERPYRVLRANDGQRALDLLRARRPDVMLLDLILPGIDGFQVLREKQRDPAIRDIPVIAISSRDPIGQPIVSDMLRVTRGGGLSMRDLVACIEAVSAALVPSDRAGDRARLESLPA